MDVMIIIGESTYKVENSSTLIGEYEKLVKVNNPN
jgi:hypothetical protein